MTPSRYLFKLLFLNLFLAATVVGVGQGGPFKHYPAGDVVSIQLERTPCFGACPVYHVTLHPDGTLIYEGTRFVDRKGKWSANYSAEDFGRLVALAKKLNFDSFNKSYRVAVTDQATQIVTVERRKTTKKVTEYGPSGPVGLWTMETVIDGIVAKASDWKQVPALRGKD